jgi:hypothetical protein
MVAKEEQVKVYVAAKFEHKEEARHAQTLLESAGHTITHDWTHESSDGLRGQARLAYFADHADRDLRGVLEAEAFLLLHHREGRGMFVELGAALANPNCIIVVVGQRDPSDRRCPIFYFHPRVHMFVDVEEAVEFIMMADNEGWAHVS